MCLMTILSPFLDESLFSCIGRVSRDEYDGLFDRLTAFFSLGFPDISAWFVDKFVALYQLG